ncbi:MAG: hypothetical protein O7D86_01855 [Proteobacteria bacterium]|nr:hypothetical protein [Pseudomonadota bacterium]
MLNQKDDGFIDDVKEEDQKVEVQAKHILLVEDNPDNRLLIKAYLNPSLTLLLKIIS